MIHESIAIESMGHISQAAADAIKVCKRRRKSGYLIFNELPIPVGPESTVEIVCATYDRLRREHHYGEHCELRRFELRA